MFIFRDHLSLVSLIKIAHAFLISSNPTKCPEYFIFRNVITLIFYGENYKLFARFDATFSDLVLSAGL
jgi:hypothetical protein